MDSVVVEEVALERRMLIQKEQGWGLVGACSVDVVQYLPFWDISRLGRTRVWDPWRMNHSGG